MKYSCCVIMVEAVTIPAHTWLTMDIAGEGVFTLMFHMKVKITRFLFVDANRIVRFLMTKTSFFRTRGVFAVN